MKNDIILRTSKRLDNVLQKIDSNVDFKDLIDSGILNKRHNGNISDVTVGPFKMVVGQNQVINHRPDKDFSRFVQVTIKNPFTGLWEVDDTNNYIIAFPEDNPEKTIVTKVKDVRNVSEHQKEIETYITVSLRESLPLFHKTDDLEDGVKIIKDTYIVNTIDCLLSLSPSFGLIYCFCVETRSLYEWNGRGWRRATEASGDFSSRYNNYDKLSYLEYNVFFLLEAGENHSMNFPVTDLFESIQTDVRQFSHTQNKFVEEYTLNKTKSSVEVINDSNGRCVFTLTIKIAYEPQFIENLYVGMVDYFVTERIVPNESRYVYMEKEVDRHIDYQHSTLNY